MLQQLQYWFSKSSDCLLHPEYEKLLKQLVNINLNQELVDFLCEKSISKKHFCEIRFYHLKILLLNKSSRSYDLKTFYYENLKRCRRLWLKMFFIRGFAMYASEAELIPIMKKFEELTKKNHDYIDYEPILSVAGLPYLVKTYGFDCLKVLLKPQKKNMRKLIRL